MKNISLIALSALASGVIAASAPVVYAQAPADTKNEVGISAHDGITMSGADVIVTRNGVSEKLTKRLELENGTRVHPDGTIITRDGSKIALRPLQVLTFDGRFLNIPVHENGGASSVSRTEITTTTAAGEKAPDAEKPSAKTDAEEIARQEAARRAKAAAEGEKPGADARK